MTTPLLDRTAQTDVPVLSVLAERWSPRAYDTERPIDETKLAAALEAARWAPSAYNGQPWRFIVARRGSDLQAQLHDALIGFNRTWATNAAALVVGIAETSSAEGRPIPHAQYDLGQAVAHLSVQAHHDGLFAHQMSGFDADAVSAAFALESRFVPTIVVALGELGDVSSLPEAIQERERAPRVRRPIADSIIASA